MYKGYKYRIYPNKKQREQFAKTFGCVRYFWNCQVALFNSYSDDNKPVYNTSTEFRKSLEWMKEVSASAIQQKEIDFKKYKNQKFSKTRKTTIGRPSFKSKRSKQSYRLPNQKFSIEKGSIKLEKIGSVKMIIDRIIPTDSKVLSVTISKDTTDCYYASILTQFDKTELPKTGKSIGIDVGIKEFATFSDGKIINNPKYFRKNQAKIKRINQILSRKKKGSSRYKKCKLRLARIHKKIANQRAFFLHNASISIVRNYDIICVEDLNLSGMMKNRKLSKSVSDASFSKFISMIAYKSEFYNKKLVKIPKFYPSSKTCSCCGHVKSIMKLSERIYICESCDNKMDRDLNAALNIKAIGVSIAQSSEEGLLDISDNANSNETLRVKGDIFPQNL